MYPIREWFETRKSKKNAEWANLIIRFIRQNDMPLVSQLEAEIGMRYLMGTQDMDFIKRLFQNATRLNLTNENRGRVLYNGFGDPILPSSESDKMYMKEMAALDFKPLPIMEKLRNIMVAEMKKMGVVLNVRSEDPTSTVKRESDKGMIENKKKLEGLLSYVYTAIGQKPYSFKDHKIRFGTKPDNGNVEDFESMGLVNEDPTDVNFFMEHFHKLIEEIAAQSVIDFTMSYNRITQEFEKFVNDIIAKKAVAATCYVSDTTGAIMYKYLAPETVWIWGGGNRQDFNDANSKRYERRMTVKEMLDVIGNKFDMEKEFNNLLLAITYTSKIEFTDIHPSYRGFVSGSESLTTKSGATYSYDQFLSFKVNVGYIEFCSWNQQQFDKTTTDKDQGFYENNQSPNGKYTAPARWETPMYKAYYLAVSQIDQVLFDFGELAYQDIEGASDVNVNYTIVTWKEPGDPIAIMAKPLLDIMNEAWFKFRYELRRAKPRGRGWNFDSVVSTLMDMIPDSNTSSMNKLQRVMEMLDSSANEIYSYPIGPDGKPMAIPGNQLNYDIPNGISKETMHWWEIIIAVGQYLSDLIGISPLREGDPGNARDSMNNQFKALEYSQAATFYVPDMLTALLQQLAIKSTFYTQDIITYKSHNTMPYNALLNGVGQDTLDKLESLGKMALHRFGIFVESLNQQPLRQKLEMLLFEAVKNKTISTAESLLINDIKSTKKAYLTFAYFEQRNRKLAEKAVQAQQQQQAEAAQALKQMEIQLEVMKNKTVLDKANIDAQAMIQAHLINQQGGLNKTALKVKADKEQVYHDANADLLKQQQLLNETGKTTMPAPMAATNGMQPQMPVDGGGMGMPREQSAAAQLRDNAEPMPTESAMM